MKKHSFLLFALLVLPALLASTLQTSDASNLRCELSSTRDTQEMYQALRAAVAKAVKSVARPKGYKSELYDLLSQVDEAVARGTIGIGAPNALVASNMPDVMASVRGSDRNQIPYIWIPQSMVSDFSGPRAWYHLGNFVRVVSDTVELSKGSFGDRGRAFRLRAVFWLLLRDSTSEIPPSEGVVTSAVNALYGSESDWATYVQAELKNIDRELSVAQMARRSVESTSLQYQSIRDHFGSAPSMQRLKAALLEAARSFEPAGAYISRDEWIHFFMTDVPDAFEARIRGEYQASDFALDAWLHSRNFEEGFELARSVRRNALIAAASDPLVVRAFINHRWVEHMSQAMTPTDDSTPSLESLFYAIAYSLQSNSFSPTGLVARETYVRAQQLEMFYLLLQFMKFRDDSKVLEIGYGSPAILLSLAAFTQNLFGLDVVELTPDIQRKAKQQFHVSLLQGRGPIDQARLASDLTPGSFNLIYSLDVLKQGPRFGVEFDPGVSTREYLHWISGLLADGGLMIVANDGRTPNLFSHEEAAAAHLEVIAWNTERAMDPFFMLMFRIKFGNEPVGHLSFTVLRRLPR